MERASAAGLRRLLVPGYDLRSSEAAITLAARHPDFIDAAVGIHPHYAGSVESAGWARLEDLAAAPGVVAIGELGLDFYRNLAPREAQVAALERQLELAARIGLPVIVHDRDAHAEISETLLAWRGPGREPKGILHCFSGDAEMALRLRAAGFLVSFALPLTFSSAAGPRAAAAALPDDGFLVETDAPWLAPGGGQARNEPTTSLRVAGELAHLRETTPEGISASVARAYARLVGGQVA
jgi:TatD DNase family protein